MTHTLEKKNNKMTHTFNNNISKKTIQWHTHLNKYNDTHIKKNNWMTQKKKK